MSIKISSIKRLFLTLFLTGRGHYGPTNLKLVHHFNTIRTRLTKAYDFVTWYVGIDWLKPCFICIWIFWKQEKILTLGLGRCRDLFALRYLTGKSHNGPIFLFFYLKVTWKHTVVAIFAPHLPHNCLEELAGPMNCSRYIVDTLVKSTLKLTRICWK